MRKLLPLTLLVTTPCLPARNAAADPAPPENGERKTDDGRRKTDDGRRETDDGRRPTVDGKQSTEDRKRSPQDTGAEVIEISGSWSGQTSEVGRITLVGDELTSVPGTLGDPLRAVTLLPGVSTGASGLSYPIIRGALPGDSRFEIDGIEIPLLFHFLIAGAVMHPRIVSDLTFEPGAYGAEHGRSIGGRVSAGMREPTERVTEVSASLVDAGAIYSDRITNDTTLTLASRAGTLGLLARALNPNVRFRYFDYQARVTHQLNNRNKVTATALGALDYFDYQEAVADERDELNLGFHRVELRHDFRAERFRHRLSVQAGRDLFRMGDRQRASTNLIRGAANASADVLPWLKLDLGADAVRRWTRGGNAMDSFDIDFSDTIRPRSTTVAGAYLVARLDLGNLSLSPGVRLDHYRYDTALGNFNYSSADPRLTASYRFAPWLTVRGAAGIYRGMSELTVAEGPVVAGPIPASDGLSAQYGLSRSTQFQLGAEIELPAEFQATLTGYYKRTRHALDYSLLIAGPELNPSDPCDFLNNDGPNQAKPEQVAGIAGRSHGVELLVRRKLGNHLSGWLSATYARSRRDVPGTGWTPYSYDQPFVANAAILWSPGRWNFGATAHVHTGRPVTPYLDRMCANNSTPQRTPGAFNSHRLPPFWRTDLRAERVFQFDDWQLSVYLDFFNALLQKEALDVQQHDVGHERLRLFVPMLGVRGEF